MLVKSGERSPIDPGFYRVQTDFIIITENSNLHRVGKIQKRKIKGPALRGVAIE
jgi:hypothetical protein